MNHAVISGNLTRDIETRSIPSGKTVAKIDIAHNEKYGDNEYTSFFTCEAWGKFAETLARCFKKGDTITLGGRLREETWEDKETGAKRSRIKLVADSVAQWPKKQNSNTSQQNQPQTTSGLDEIAENVDNQDDGVDDIPF